MTDNITPIHFCPTCYKMVSRITSTTTGGFMCNSCGSDTETISKFHAMRGKDARRALAWRGFSESGVAEPITESLYFSDVIELLRDELESGSDNSKTVMRMLRAGMRDYLDQCRDLDEDAATENEEARLDRCQRSRDLRAEIARTTESLYGVKS